MCVADNLDMRNKSLICEHQRICESYCGKAEHGIALRATDLSWFIFFPQVVINRRRGQFIFLSSAEGCKMEEGNTFS